MKSVLKALVHVADGDWKMGFPSFEPVSQLVEDDRGGLVHSLLGDEFINKLLTSISIQTFFSYILDWHPSRVRSAAEGAPGTDYIEYESVLVPEPMWMINGVAALPMELMKRKLSTNGVEIKLRGECNAHFGGQHRRKGIAGLHREPKLSQVVKYTRR